MHLQQLGYIIVSVTFVIVACGINALPTGSTHRLLSVLTDTSTGTATGSSVEDVKLDVTRWLKRYSDKTHDKDEEYKDHPKKKEHKGHSKNKGHNDDDSNNGNVNGWLSSDPDGLNIPREENDSMPVPGIYNTEEDGDMLIDSLARMVL